MCHLLPLTVDASDKSVRHSDPSTINRLQVGSCGGASAIIGAMAAFPSDAELQGEACTAVTNLSHNCDRNRKLVAEGGGLVLILNAMQASKSSYKQVGTIEGARADALGLRLCDLARDVHIARVSSMPLSRLRLSIIKQL